MSKLSERNKEEQFLLKVVQPSLLGFMDGSISTLAPVFGFAVSGDAKTAFMAGTLVSVGAGISMGQAEAISDDGKLTGRGSPVMRGIITGVATFVGGMLHTVPFLIEDINVAKDLAIIITVFELALIAVIKWKYMKSKLFTSFWQVYLGGGLVIFAGIFLERIISKFLT
jgi:VIT1/CCC1 family predicted Fe2+/Mn2+ transporter